MLLDDCVEDLSRVVERVLVKGLQAVGKEPLDRGLPLVVFHRRGRQAPYCVGDGAGAKVVVSVVCWRSACCG